MRYTYNGTTGSERQTLVDTTDWIEVYLHEVARIPALSEKEEQTLAERIDRERQELRQVVFSCETGLRLVAAILAVIRKNPGALDQYVRVSGKGDVRDRALDSLTDLHGRIESSLGLPANGKRPEERCADLARPLSQTEFHMATIRGIVADAERTDGPRAEVHEALSAYQESVRTLCSGHLTLVVGVAKRMPTHGLQLADLIQEGNTGLLSVADRYTARSGPFARFARGPIQDAIRRFIADQARLIRLPAPQIKALRRLVTFRRDFRDAEGREPTVAEAARKLSVCEDEIHMLDRLERAPVSIDEPLDGEDMTTVGDLIEDPVNISPAETIHRTLLQRRLVEVLRTLNVRERNVLRLRFGLSNGRNHTVNEVAEILRVSPNRVRKLQTVAFRKLKDSEFRAELESMLDSIE